MPKLLAGNVGYPPRQVPAYLLAYARLEPAPQQTTQGGTIASECPPAATSSLEHTGVATGSPKRPSTASSSPKVRRRLASRHLIRAWWSMRCLTNVRWLTEAGIYGPPEEFPEVAVLRSQM